jgi:hydroxyacylglutathione hydrolase
VWLIPVLNDNYVIVLERRGQAVLVDPAVAEPVIEQLERRGLQLVAILHTHHHQDHIGGTPGLLRRWPAAAVIAAASDRERIPLQTRSVADGDQLQLLGRQLQVLAVPGHTAHHIAYYLPAAPASGEPPELLCGDTLFAAGCGRLFEGSPTQMRVSLGRFAALPDATRVWCAHEYTEANLRWAHAQVDGADPAAVPIAERLQAVISCRQRGEASIPSSIGLEKQTNLFMRTADAEQLAQLRRHKDHWRG